jgi:hypothetical protein
VLFLFGPTTFTTFEIFLAKIAHDFHDFQDFLQNWASGKTDPNKKVQKYR